MVDDSPLAFHFRVEQAEILRCVAEDAANFDDVDILAADVDAVGILDLAEPLAERKPLVLAHERMTMVPIPILEPGNYYHSRN